MPLCFISVSKEDRVDNTQTAKLAKVATNQENEVHMIEGADHSNIVFDEAYVKTMLFQTLAFFDKLR